MEKFGESHTGHQFQFEIWKHALDVKYSVNTLLIVIQAFVMLYYSNRMIKHATNVHESGEEIYEMRAEGETDEAQYDTFVSFVNSEADSAISMIETLFVLNIGSVAYLIEDLQNINKFKFNARIQVFNLIAVITYIVWIVEHYMNYTVNVPLDDRGELSRNVMIIDEMYKEFDFTVKYFAAILT